MAKPLTPLLLAICIASLLSSCASVKITRNPDRVTQEGIDSARSIQLAADAPSHGLARLAETTAATLTNARLFEKKGQSDNAATSFFKAAVDAGNYFEAPNHSLESDTASALIDIHNRSLARFAEIWLDRSDDPKADAREFVYQDIRFKIEMSPTSDYQPDFFDRAISAESITGKGVISKTRDGVGATMVGIRERTAEREEEMTFYARDLHLPVTAVIERVDKSVEGGQQVVRVKLSLKNPLLHEYTSVQGRRLPLAANFSAPLETLLDGNSELRLALARFFYADEVAKKSGIYLLEPYDPDRIPVILTHGLVSVPLIWRDIIPQLMAEPELASRFQFMVFTYPSSYPITESSLLYRRQLAALRAHYDPEGRDPLSTDVVAVGHSMGGVLTHLLVTEIGDNLWNEVSDTPLENLDLTSDQRQRAIELLKFQADQGVDRAIFLSTPHRGAYQAEGNIAGWLSGLAKLPVGILNELGTLFQVELSDHLKIDTQRKMTSVQSLRPDSPIVKALDISPYREGVIYHSIIGDRGLGDTPNSSDGHVEYWSSHQEGAASELIVPTEHSSYTHPNSVAEIKRILRVHAGLE